MGAGDVIASDDVSGVKYQIVKLATGALDTVALAPSGSGTSTDAIRVELPTNGTGVVGLSSKVTTTLDHGSNRDIRQVAEQITSTSAAAKFGVILRADKANTGTLYIGNSDVTAGTTAGTDGIPLDAGESLLLRVNNANIPYAIATADNQIIYWKVV